MIQAGNRSSLALESLFELGVIRQMGRQDLDGNGSIEAGVLGFVNLALYSCRVWFR